MLDNNSALRRAGWYLERLDEMGPWERAVYMAVLLQEAAREAFEVGADNAHADRKIEADGSMYEAGYFAGADAAIRECRGVVRAVSPWLAHTAGDPLARKLGTRGECVDVARAIADREMAKIAARMAEAHAEPQPDAPKRPT